MNLVMRQATVNDIPVLIQMRWDMKVEQGLVDVSNMDSQSLDQYRNYEQAMLNFLDTYLSRNECQIWLALDDTIPVATAALWLFPQLPWAGGLNEWRGYVSNLYTLPTYRRMGIGTQLMKAIREVAAAYGVVELLLDAEPDSTSIYHRLGFVPSQLLAMPVTPAVTSA